MVDTSMADADADADVASRRQRWMGWLERVAGPVLAAAGEGRLAASLPAMPGREDRAPFAPAEACIRTLAGIAPWMELSDVPTAEQELQRQMQDAARRAIGFGVEPGHPDRWPFERPGQPLVEAAFLCHALLRAPSLYDGLEGPTRVRLFAALRASRSMMPYNNNWVLFAAMVEAWMLSIGKPHDPERLHHALDQFGVWYMGDGTYGDGPELHHDYYNSFVIQPMLIDILNVIERVEGEPHPMAAAAAERFTRYAAVQERQIGPDGTYPPVGRSLCYRCGAFHHLAQAALQHRLPEAVAPAQVREALTSVITRGLDAPRTFNEDGWLRPGLAGHQPGLAEGYICTGSLYACSLALLPLGLPEGDAFWADPPEPWTSRRLWAGEDLPADRALGA